MSRMRAFLASLIVTAGLVIGGFGWLLSSYVKTMAEFEEQAPPPGWWHDAAMGIPIGLLVIVLGIYYGTRRA
jgi:H+/Cl- antiporter ClcA